MADDRPSEADPSESELSSEEGGQDVSEETPSEESSVKEELEEVAGREFEDLDDFKKHYENLKSFSGTEEAQEMRKKANKYDEIIDKADGLMDNMSEEDKKEIQKNEEKSRLDRLENEFKKSEFLREHPDAEDHMDLVEAYAQAKDMSYADAWNEKLEDYGVSKSEKEKEKSDSTNSKSRIAPQKREKVNNLAKQAKSGSDKAAEELVKELGLTE